MSNIILIHGGLGKCSAKDHWFPYVKTHFKKAGLKVIAKNFPDPEKTDFREWYTFLQDTCKPTEESIIIGHSMGAVLAQRYAMENTIAGLVLVSSFFTILDEEIQRTGFIPTVWDWNRIRTNTAWIMQYHTADDPYIKMSEAKELAFLLNSEFYEFAAGYHFGNEDYPCPAFPHLVSEVLKKIRSYYTSLRL